MHQVHAVHGPLERPTCYDDRGPDHRRVPDGRMPPNSVTGNKRLPVINLPPGRVSGSCPVEITELVALTG